MLNQKYLKKIAIFLEPPIVCGADSYRAQIRSHARNLRNRKIAVQSLVHFLRLASVLLTAWALSPVSVLLRAFGIHFVTVDLSQIGSVLWLDLYLREQHVRGRTSRHRVFVSRSKYIVPNPYVLKMYEPYVTFVDHMVLKVLFMPLFSHPIFQERTTRFEHTYTYVERKTTFRSPAQRVYQDYAARFGKPLVALSGEEIARGRELLKNHMDPTKPFVAIHARDSGYYWSSNIRNSNILDFDQAIAYLIEKGFTVVRMGDPKMTRIDDLNARFRPQLFDYAHSTVRSDFLDCFLTSQCAFFVGGSSGLWSLPCIFEVPSCNVNFYNVQVALGFLPQDLVTFKTYRYTANNSLVPLGATMRPPFSLNLSAGSLKKLGVVVEESSKEDILQTVKEFVERESHKPTALQLKAKNLMPEDAYCFGANGNFSETVLRKYAE